MSEPVPSGNLDTPEGLGLAGISAIRPGLLYPHQADGVAFLVSKKRAILDESHFIKNASQRTSHCLKLMGVADEARQPLIGPSHVFLLTGTPMTNRPRDLFNLLRCVGHPAARSFLSFANATAMPTATTMGGSRRGPRTSRNSTS